MSVFETETEKISNLDTEDQKVLDAMGGWFGLSIVSIIFCGFTGIVATVFAFLARSAKKEGDYTTAVSYARKARLLAIISFVLGGLGILSQLINSTAGV